MKCRHSTVLAYLMISETLQIPIKYCILVLLLLEVGKYRKKYEWKLARTNCYNYSHQNTKWHFDWTKTYKEWTLTVCFHWP